MGGVRPNASENGQISPSSAVRSASGGGSRPSRDPTCQNTGYSQKLVSVSGVIRGIPVNIFGKQLSPRILIGSDHFRLPPLNALKFAAHHGCVGWHGDGCLTAGRCDDAFIVITIELPRA